MFFKLLSEIGFFKCVDDSVKWLSQFSDQPVYYYQYAHHGQNSLTKLLNVPQDSDFGEFCLRRKWWLIINSLAIGVCHGDELLLMFTSNLIPPMTDPGDIRASKMLLDLWTSFSANGYYYIYFNQRRISEFYFLKYILHFVSFIQGTAQWRNYWPLASDYATTAPLPPDRLGESRSGQWRDAISIKAWILDIFIAFLFWCSSSQRGIVTKSNSPYTVRQYTRYTFRIIKLAIYSLLLVKFLSIF